jgi:DNA-binding transcriptional ArsR family regulator
MAKNNFILIDLNDSKIKKLAETITSKTSRKILDHLTEKEETEANIAKVLEIPISTVHYHLQKLQEAKLVTVDEFHYSSKGREVNHYKLANKYIIIAPRKVSGLKQALKNVLPIGLVVLGISAVIKFMSTFAGVQEMAVAQKTVGFLAEEALIETAREGVSQPDIALWFLIGGLSAMGIYLIVALIKEWRKK